MRRDKSGIRNSLVKVETRLMLVENQQSVFDLATNE